MSRVRAGKGQSHAIEREDKVRRLLGAHSIHKRDDDSAAVPTKELVNHYDHSDQPRSVPVARVDLLAHDEALRRAAIEFCR